MENYSQTTLNALINCLGKTVLDVSRVQYYFDEKEYIDGFGDLEFTFTDNTHLSISGVGDAETIKALNDKLVVPEPFNVTDINVASWRRLDLKREIAWNKLIGQKIQYIEIIWKWDKYIKGCIIYLNIDFLIFYETESDTNKCHINERPSWLDINLKADLKLEKIYKTSANSAQKAMPG